MTAEVIEIMHIHICPECKNRYFEVCETRTSEGPYCRCIECGWTALDEEKAA